MTNELRIEMIVMSLIFVITIFHFVNKKKLSLKYSLIWIVISISMLIIGIFPKIAMGLCSLTNIQTPSNLVFLLGIFALLGICFILTTIVSEQSKKINQLIQMLSIDKHLYKESSGDKKDIYKK